MVPLHTPLQPQTSMSSGMDMACSGLMAGIADGALAKHQVVADLRDVLALAHLAEVPAAVGGVAVEAGTDQRHP